MLPWCCSQLNTSGRGHDWLCRCAAVPSGKPEDVGLSTERLQRHFMRGTGSNTGLIRVKPELRRLVEFRPMNLMHTRWSLGEPFDVVFCRNVMIYFDAPTQRQVLERMHAVMRPQALLFAGHSENFTHSKDLFRLRGKTIYERT